ncbi:glycoside hydrolase family 13 protein [Humibacter albus]|uniref:glycoside hydrolase family 13 protein n=1 Tax=Humibacter albus TaxID=427754 RepID=UPI0003B2F098|nr:glycoside hydrolase family 13 protein [Humibacter albus]
MLQPHHDGSPLYVSDPTPRMGDSVAVRVRIPREFGPVKAVRSRSNPDHEPRFTDAAKIGSCDGWDWWQASIEVENPVHGYRFLITRGDGSSVWLNATGVWTTETLDVDDFRLVAYDAPPTWVRSSVLYQVFPDRFARSGAAADRPAPDWAIPAKWSDPVDDVPPGRSQQFYGGDLDGAAERLDYLAELGVTLVYLTPVFPGRSNHRYDASSFAHVDPLLGGDEALARFTAAAHERGLKVIGDLTTNHCGDGHEWFRAALGHPEAPESEFFYWLDDAHTKYVAWLGVPNLPKLNWASQELRRRFIEGPDSVVARWLQPPYSLDGWRIDVANMTGRYREDDFNAEVRRIIRRTMIEVSPDTILLGESTNDAAPDFQGDAWHGAMTYANFTRPVWGWLSRPGSESTYFGQPVGVIPSYTGQELVDAHTRFAAAFPWRVRQGTMNALDTHDVPRFRTHARPGAVPVAFGLSVTMPGIPVVWAGDELGLTADDGEGSRMPMPWGLLDGVRSVAEGGPATNVAGPAAGANAETPDDVPDPATGATASEARATHDLYRGLIRLRREHVALNDGGFRWLHVGDDVLVFVREHAEESVLVFASRTAADVRLELDAVAGWERAEVVYGDIAIDVDAAGEEDDGGVRLAVTGPQFAAVVLPGVRL